MYLLTMGPGTNLGFPDVCITPVPSPVGPVPTPIPYPNINVPVNSSPVATSVLAVCMPVINQSSQGLLSSGDEPGTMGGVASHRMIGQTNYELGCFTIFIDGPPAQRLTSMTGQNAMGKLMNTPGTCISPTQTTVLTLG
jgi:hypothetical protein